MRPCTHGMPTPGTCFECMEEGNLPAPDKPEPLIVGAVFMARYGGHCRGCNLPFNEGQWIARMSDGTYQHDECGYRTAKAGKA